MRMRSLAVVATVATLPAIVGCSPDDGGGVASTASGQPTLLAVGGDPALDVVAGEPFPAKRCEANREAGTLTFLTGFGLEAASSTVEVLTADAAGYYDDLCLEVEVRPGDVTTNPAAVGAGAAQFAGAGSFSEIVGEDDHDDPGFLVTSVDGRSAIDTLIVRAGAATEPTELRGATLGVQDEMAPSISVMLRGAGLVRGVDYSVVQLGRADPLANIGEPIDGLAGSKSGEVGTLNRAGVGIQLFDPLDYGVPGSFGVVYTSAAFAEAHPTAATDFARATARGLADAIADPAGAADTAVTVLTTDGESNRSSDDVASAAETFRWETEAGLVVRGTPEGVGFGTPDAPSLQAELDAYAEVGFFGDDVGPLDATDHIGAGIVRDIYDDSMVVWPS